LITDRNAESVVIKDPIGRASSALSINQVPSPASAVSGLGIVGFRIKARSVDEVVSSIAVLAFAI
jgi:hypothetical protein